MTTDKFAALEAVTPDTRAELFNKQGRPALLAELKHTDRPRYERLIATYRKNRIPQLRDLEREVDKCVRDAQKKRNNKPRADDGFKRNEDGHIVTTQENIRLAVTALGVRLSYNEFSGVPIIEGLPDFGPALEDAALDRLWLQMDAELDFRPAMDQFRRVVIDACRRNKFHPVRDYLDGLQWDGVPRLDTWLIRYCLAEDTPFNRAVGALTLIAAVRRIRQPGSKFDTILTLESPEGYSKSAMLAALASWDEWFTNSIPLAASDKIMIEQSRGKWISEIAELTGRHSDVDKIKAQASRQSDRARMAYAELAIEVPRQFVMIGTTNNKKYLTSLTGNRRFWPVTVGFIDLAAFRVDVDQLWAEAALREKEGLPLTLPEDMWPTAATVQSEREMINPYQDVIAGYLDDRRGCVFATTLWDMLNVPVMARNGHAYTLLNKAMAALGFKQMMHGSQSRRCYVKGAAKTACEITVNHDHGQINIYQFHTPLGGKFKPNSE